MSRPSFVPPVGQRPRLGTCPKCAAYIIEALDSPVAARHVRLDPTPVDLATELAATLTGRASYALRDGARPFVQHRDSFVINAHRSDPVLLEHRCAETTTHVRTLPRKPRRTTKTTEVAF